MARLPRDDEDNAWMSKVKIAAVPTPKRKPSRDYSPKKPEDMPGITEMVWESYTTGKTMVIGCPPDKVDNVRAELLKAKNYLMYIHRDDEPKVDIRGIGMEKTDLEVVQPEDILDTKLRTQYRRAVPPGWVGVRFTARPPLMKGARVTRANAVARATSPQARREATIRDISSGRKVPARKTASNRPTIPNVPFSG